MRLIKLYIYLKLILIGLKRNILKQRFLEAKLFSKKVFKTQFICGVKIHWLDIKNIANFMTFK